MIVGWLFIIEQGEKMRGIEDRVLTPNQKKKVLERFDYVCVYCFTEAETVDHVIPWSYAHDDSEDNLVAACWLCNLIAHNKMFDTLSHKQEYVIAKKYNWIKRNPIPLWTMREINGLGRILKKYVTDSVMILDDEDQRQKVKRILLDEGFRVIVGEYAHKVSKCNIIAKDFIIKKPRRIKRYRI